MFPLVDVIVQLVPTGETYLFGERNEVSDLKMVGKKRARYRDGGAERECERKRKKETQREKERKGKRDRRRDREERYSREHDEKA